MEKEFVPYELAVKLKEIGFDEPCFAYYEPNKKFEYVNWETFKDFPYLAKNSEWQDLYGAPTYSQAFRWFREQGFLIDFSSHNKDAHDFYFKWSENKSILSDTYDTYEETELACLENLIEIVENNLSNY